MRPHGGHGLPTALQLTSSTPVVAAVTGAGQALRAVSQERTSGRLAKEGAHSSHMRALVANSSQRRPHGIGSYANF
jgi:hypothetical protein